MIGAEFRKLRTIRGPWLMLAAQQAIIVAGISGLIASGEDLAIPTGTRSALAHAGIPAILTLVLGITAVAGEYRHRTITDTYLGSPRRLRVLAAKLVAYTALGTVFGLLNAATALGVTALATDLDPGDAVVWRTLAGGVAWNALYAAIGVGVGAAVRNLTVAVAGALVWIAIVETALTGLLGDAADRLPNASAFALAYLPTGTPVSQWAGGLALVGYAVLCAVAGAAITVRRDVT